MNCLGALSVSSVLLCAWLAAGCAGYRIGPVSNPGYKSVAVPVFKNKTLIPQLEAQITNGVIKRLQADGTLQVDSKENADVILVGEIVRYRRQELRTSRDDSNQPREYRITIEARVEAHDRVSGMTVLKPTTVSGNAATFIGSDLQTAEYQALPFIADDLAQRVVSLLVENW